MNFIKKSNRKYYQILWKLLNGPQVIISLAFDDTDALTVAFTTKTGQTVAHNIQKLFLFVLFFIRERIHLGMLRGTLEAPD